MTWNEVNEILKWLGTTDLTKLSVREQLIIQASQLEMCEAIRPIYIRHKIDSCDPFIMRLGE